LCQAEVLSGKNAPKGIIKIVSGKKKPAKEKDFLVLLCGWSPSARYLSRLPVYFFAAERAGAGAQPFLFPVVLAGVLSRRLLRVFNLLLCIQKKG
jgi:hypothetical protein